MANTGPASTQTSNSLAQFVPVNTITTGTPVGINNNRAICVGRAVSLATTGDAIFMPVINMGTYSIASIITTNGLVNGLSATVATASIGLFTGAGATGTTLRTAGVLTGQTTSATVVVAVGATTLAQTAQGIYLNVGTALAGATVDIFVIGYDLT